MRGFTLVELSIALVIIGLIVGGIMAGQSLVRAAELNAIGNEKYNFETAIVTFRDKYVAYPGDMPNAYQAFGAECGTNTTTASTGCNGNGDTLIKVDGGETVLAWEHLSRAELIEGNYDGTGALTAGYVRLSATNSPSSKMPGGYWEIASIRQDLPGSRNGTLYLSLAALDTPLSSAYLDTPLRLTRQEAWSVDVKIDNGFADSGALRGNSGDDCNDGSGGGAYGASADLGGDPNAKDCTLTFVLK